MSNSFKEESKKLTVSVVDGADHDLDAEAMSMLGALCSRSQEGPKANLALVKERGASAFMEKFYIGYGHSSVGKLSTTSVFISGVSMLAINYLQNINPLYVGQESSTRYIPFESEGIYLPESMGAFRPLMTSLMETYTSSMIRVKEHLHKKLEKPEGVSDKKWKLTINARAFDICRSILPAGCLTTGMWNGNLENFRQILTIAIHCENDEVVNVSKAIYASLQERYPSSFPEIDLTLEERVWYTASANTPKPNINVDTSRGKVYHNMVLCSRAEEELSKLPARPKYAPLPDCLGMYGRINFVFDIDFGGYRDINRHRKGNCRRGPLTIDGQFNPWYLSQMPDDVALRVLEIIGSISRFTTRFNKSHSNMLGGLELEYIVPMGINVTTEISYPIDNAVFVSELRSGITVHPTVRNVAQQMGKLLQVSIVGKYVNMYHNMGDVDTLDVRRADQTITEK